MRRVGRFLLLAVIVLATACDSGSEPEVSIHDVVIGDGLVADGRALVTITYVGRFTNGEVFDSSEKWGPLTFELETGIIQGGQENRRVIEGLVRGVPGMRVGGVRRITVPPELAYGRDGLEPHIPGQATLIFQIELLTVQDKPS